VTSRRPGDDTQDGADLPLGVAGCIDAAARFLSAQPGAVERALITHRPRPDGRCRLCRPLTRWPCTMASIARAAVAAAPRQAPISGMQRPGLDRAN
jgi:hypothetical protein